MGMEPCGQNSRLTSHNNVPKIPPQHISTLNAKMIMPQRDDFSIRIPIPFVRSNYPPPLRAEYYSGDTISAGSTLLIAHSALLGINQVTNSKGVIAGPMDGIPDVGVGGRSDARFNVGVYGYSENGTGVHCKSETYEALHAETNSTETAAIAAYQLNATSNSAALFARHEGGGAAAVFDGDVHIHGRLFVNGGDAHALMQRVEALEGKIVTLQNQVVDIMNALQNHRLFEAEIRNRLTLLEARAADNQ